MPKYKRSYTTGSKANWIKFKKEYPEHKDLPYQTFRAILMKDGELITDYLLETGDKIALSHGIGEITITRRKMRKYKNKQSGELEPSHYSINWKATREVGHYVYHKNYNTNGYYATWTWFPRTSRIKFARLWDFEFLKVHKQKLAQLLFTDSKKTYLLYKEHF